jgi:predicted TIM-barrel fold metal-dependent hydrolase
MNYIDAHVHVWTPDLAHYPLGPGWKREDMQPPSFTPEELFKHCKPAGVNRINLIQMSFYGPKDPTSGRGKDYDNRYMLDMMKLYGDVFVGTAVIDPEAEGAERLMAEQAKQRVRAYRIYPGLTKQPPARWLQPVGYARLFAAGAEHNQAMSCLIDPDALPELDRMCRRFPETPVVIDHLCGIGGNPQGTIPDKEVEALCAMARHKRVLVKVGAFYALGKKQPPYTDLGPLIRRVVQAFGARRCLWESDCPFQVVKDKYRDSLDLIRTRLDFLTAEDKDWLLRRTAEDFFWKNKRVGA